MNTEKLTWYAARSGGIVAWLLLALGLILGLLLSSRVLGKRASPAWLLSIHRFLGGLSVIFTFVHVGAIMLDDFVAFGWTDVLVPWASEWNPGAVAWGIIATYLAIAIELTSFAMRRLPKGLWRGVHWLSAPLFVMATVHGYQAGTDAGRAFIIAIVAACVALAALTVVRVLNARRQTEPKTDPRVLLEQAKARRAKRNAAVDGVVTDDRLASSWQADQRAPAVVADHAATPAPAWTDLQPTAAPTISTAPEPDQSWTQPDVSVSPPTQVEPTRPSTEQPFWEPTAPAAEPVRQSDEQPFWEPAEPVADPRPADQPFWEPTEPVAASIPDRPNQPAPATAPAARNGEPSAQPAEPAPPVLEPTPDPAPPVLEPAIITPEPAPPVFEPTPEPASPVLDPTTRPEPARAVFDPAPDPAAVVRTAQPTAAAGVDNAASAPVFEPAQVEVSHPEAERRRVPELEHAGAPGESTAPRPAWTEPDDLAWLTADAGRDPRIERRPGPVPGVWKRTRRDAGDYANDN